MRPPDEVRKELVHQWISRAQEDIGVARHLIQDEFPYTRSICFHAQQAAEKFLKAVLVHFQIEFPKTHNIGELLSILSTVDSETASALEETTALNPYGVDIRYPSDFPDVSIKDAHTAIELAEHVYSKIQIVLSDYF